jgi:hypothetical protein
LLYHQRQKVLGHFGLQQTVAVLGEHRGIPHCIVQIQPHERAGQNVVVDLLYQQPLAAHRVQHLQQHLKFEIEYRGLNLER